jgi:aspartate racemase
VRTIGIIGGMSWESTVTYYQLINEEVGRRLGGFHSASVLLSSVDFAEIERMQTTGAWDDAGRALSNEAAALERAGADLLILATNTMHKVAETIERAVSIPMLHIADATGRAVVAAGVETVALLGTRYTMEQDFYRGRLASRFGLKVLVPDAGDRATVDAVIFDELVHGIVSETSKRSYIDIIGRLVELGAEGVILGCTEIGLLVGPEDIEVPAFDTTRLHATAAVAAAMET